jgi:uncharacterized protein YndB with AHSA1/START domain
MPATSADTTQIYTVFIRTTPEKLWSALVDPSFTEKYFHGTRVSVELRKGARITYEMPNGSVAVDGEVLAADPPRRLSYTWVIHYDPKLSHERSTVTWEIEKRGAVCKLTATHELAGAPLTAKNVSGEGWGTVLSGLKTLLETGEPLNA